MQLERNGWVMILPIYFNHCIRMKKITLISYHSWNSKRKAGFHWLATSYATHGYSVVFITASLSLLSVLYRDHRCKTITKKNCLTKISKNLSIFPYFTLFHPENYLKIKILRENKSLSRLLSVIDLLLTLFFYNYGKKIPKQLEEAIIESDYCIFECTPGIMLFEEFRRINPDAKMIYRVSDDMGFLNHHPIVIEYEKKIIHNFDLISVPSPYMIQKLSQMDKVKLHPHGIKTDYFGHIYPIPKEYHRFEKNFVFVGCSYFDDYFLTIASSIFSSYGFHIIGPIKAEVYSQNVIYYGELDFSKTVPFIVHADVGLQTLFSESSVQIFSISLKILQYTWCRLPIIVPWDIGKDYPHFFPYDRDENSIKTAIENALLFDRWTIDRSWIHSWDEIASEIIKDADSA